MEEIVVLVAWLEETQAFFGQEINHGCMVVEQGKHQGG